MDQGTIPSPRIKPLSPEHSPELKEQFEAMRKNLGFIPERGSVHACETSRPDRRLCRFTPSASAILTSSGSDRAPIFCITRPRWALTVISSMPSSPAICLFIMPAVTRAITSSSLGLRVSRCDLRAASCRSAARRLWSRSSAAITASSMSCSRNGFIRKSTAPPFMALTDTETSLSAVMKMMGMESFACASSVCRSRPLNLGILTSSTRQLTTSGSLLASNSAAEPNILTLRATERNRRAPASRGNPGRHQRRKPSVARLPRAWSGRFDLVFFVECRERIPPFTIQRQLRRRAVAPRSARLLC